MSVTSGQPQVGEIVSTLEALRLLPGGSVVITPLGEAWQKHADEWVAGGRDVTIGDEVLLAAGSSRLLLVYVPGAEPSDLHQPVSEMVAEVREDVDAAVEDYRRVFPEPHALSPNLDLAVRATRLLASAPALSREQLIELIPVLHAPQNVAAWPADEQELHRRTDWRSFTERAEALDQYRREKLADAILAALHTQTDAQAREARP